MPRRSASRSPARKPTRRRTRSSRGSKTLWKRLPSKRTRQRWQKRGRRVWRGLPPLAKWPLVAVVIALLWLAVNGVYQVVRKPSELFFPIAGALHKSPASTWRAYAPLFRRHATDVITADLLAALAQVEGSGNPVARTYWRWSFTRDPFAIYRPASSGVGMYQITDGTFDQARRYCIHAHAVVADGPWHDWRSCWFNLLYTRVLPSHAIELTSAYLDRSVAQALRRHPVRNASLRAKQELAALIHLCGAGAGKSHARRGLRLEKGQRCGNHDVRRYLDRVAAQQKRFRQLEAASHQGG